MIMILSDKTIRSMLSNGTLGITPLEDHQIQPASVDIRLGLSLIHISSFLLLNG